MFLDYFLMIFYFIIGLVFSVLTMIIWFYSWIIYLYEDFEPKIWLDYWYSFFVISFELKLFLIFLIFLSINYIAFLLWKKLKIWKNIVNKSNLNYFLIYFKITLVWNLISNFLLWSYWKIPYYKVFLKSFLWFLIYFIFYLLIYFVTTNFIKFSWYSTLKEFMMIFDLLFVHIISFILIIIALKKSS